MSKILAANPNAVNDSPSMKKIGAVSVEAFSNTSVPQRRVFAQVAPSTGVSGNIINGGTLEFNIENNVDRIGTVYLRVDYANTTANPCVLAAPPTHLNYIEIYSSNRSNLLYHTNSAISHFLIDSAMLSRTEWDCTANLRGTDANYSTAPVTIAANSTGSFYYHIAPNFWRALKLRPYCIEGNLVVHLRFHPGATSIVSGSLSTPNVVLEMTGYMEGEGQKGFMKKRAEVPKALSYYAPQIHMEPQILTAGNKCTIRLSGINGYVNQIYFAIRPVANATIPANLFTFVRPASFDILDPSSHSLTGNKHQTASDMVILYSHMYDNLFINNTNACVYSFSQSPVADVATGNYHGGVEMRGAHYLEFTPAANLVSGSYEIHVIGLCNESLELKQAIAKTSR